MAQDKKAFLIFFNDKKHMAFHISEILSQISVLIDNVINFKPFFPEPINPKKKN